jgi:hypothetical protein
MAVTTLLTGFLSHDRYRLSKNLNTSPLQKSPNPIISEYPLLKSNQPGLKMACGENASKKVVPMASDTRLVRMNVMRYFLLGFIFFKSIKI